jgi:hypothetical protein
LSTFSPTATAQENNDVTFIEKNQKAPYSGLLFTEEKASELRRDVLEGDKARLRLEGELFKSESFLRVIKLKDEEIDLYHKQNQRLERAASTSSTMQYVWFGLGILATSVAVYGARGLANK